MGKQNVRQVSCRVPNLDEESDMLEWAGVSFGQDFNYKLSKSIKVTKLNLLIHNDCRDLLP